MKTNGIRKELFRSHITVALASLIIITLLINAAVFVSFNGYVRNQQQAELQLIVQELSAAYTAEKGWPTPVLMSISHRAMLRNITVRITDAKGQTIWDTSDMKGHMPFSEADASSLTINRAEQAPIEKDGTVIGHVRVGETGGIFQGQEKSFLLRINIWIWLAFLFVMLGVYKYSKHVSSRISRPLLFIKETAGRMTEGDLNARVHLANVQSEIRELGDALNHLAEKLQSQEGLRKNMTADIAHELRTPIATIRSHVEAFQDEIWEPTPEKLEICHQQVMQLILLIQDLEKLAEAENPMLRLQKEELNLIPIISEAQVTVRQLSEGKNIHYHAPEQKDIRCLGDYRRLLQVFVNLIGNAYKYTPEGGTVSVRIKQDADSITVQIEDTGLGIGEEELPYIFERFYRGEKSRNRKLGGAGIGLAVVKALVEAHEGSISVESDPHSGSIFTVKLPKC